MQIVAPDIKNDFGGDGGIQEFIKIWNPESADSRLWSGLSTILVNGGGFGHDNTFCAPYVFSHWPHDVDAFEWYALMSPHVELKKGDASNSPTIQILSYAIVRPIEYINPYEISGNILVEYMGLRGYVPRHFMRSPIEYRACFEQREGTWVLKTLVAGD